VIRLRERVILYFVANPEEELVASDLALKFNVIASTVREALPGLVEDKLLSARLEKLTAQRGGPSFVYSAGPLIREALKAAEL